MTLIKNNKIYKLKTFLHIINNLEHIFFLKKVKNKIKIKENKISITTDMKNY